MPEPIGGVLMEQLLTFISTNQDLIVAGLFFLGLAYLLVSTETKRRRHRKGPRARFGVVPHPKNMTDPKAQMAAVSKVGFEVQRLLNKEEAPLLPILETAARGIGKGHRVMAQTSLGEVLRPQKGRKGDNAAQQRAFASINSKRLDFAIIDRFGMIVCAVEYQGTGHYHEKSFMRDAVKREALRKAGVPWLEIRPGYEKNRVINDIRDALGEEWVERRDGVNASSTPSDPP